MNCLDVVKSPGLLNRPWFKFGLIPTTLVLLWVPSIIWIFRDKKIWAWDQSWFGSSSLNLSHTLLNLDFRGWLTTMINTTPAKPPLLPWSAQFLGLLEPIFRADQRVLLFINIVFVGLICYFSYKLIENITNSLVAAFSVAVLLSGSKLFVGLSHQFLAETAQCFAIVYFIHSLVSVRKKGEDSKFSSRISFVLSVNFILLSKANTLLLISPFLVFVPIRNLIKISLYVKEFKNETALIKFKAMSALMLSSLTILWYAFNYQQVANHFYLATKGLETYATGVTGLNQVGYWIRALLFNDSKIVFIFLITTAAMVIHFAKTLYTQNHKDKFSSKKFFQWETNGYLLTLSAATILNFVLVVAGNNSDPRFLTTLILFISLLTASIMSRCSKIATNVLAVMILSVACLTQLASLSVSGSNATAWYFEPMASGEKNLELRGVFDEVCGFESETKKVYINVELPDVNANTFTFYYELFYNNSNCVFYSHNYG